MSDALKERLLQTEISRQMPDLINANASDYITGLIKGWYEINDNGEFQVTATTPVGKDAKPVQIESLGALLRQSHGYLFKPQAPAGTEPAPRFKPRNEMTLAEKSQAMRELTEAEYLALPLTAAEIIPPESKRRRDLSIQERAYLMRREGEKYLDRPW